MFSLSVSQLFLDICYSKIHLVGTKASAATMWSQWICVVVHRAVLFALTTMWASFVRLNSQTCMSLLLPSRALIIALGCFQHRPETAHPSVLRMCFDRKCHSQSFDCVWAVTPVCWSIHIVFLTHVKLREEGISARSFHGNVARCVVEQITLRVCARAYFGMCVHLLFV